MANRETKTDLAALLELVVVLVLLINALFGIPAAIKILGSSDPPPPPPDQSMNPQITVNKEVKCGPLSFGCGGKENSQQENNGAWR